MRSEGISIQPSGDANETKDTEFEALLCLASAFHMIQKQQSQSQEGVSQEKLENF
jgi:hypothetical protein